MTRFRLRALMTALALACAASTGSAAAAVDTDVPTTANARTFATSAGGWTSSVTTPALCLCPSATATYATPGTAGGTDGYLRTAISTSLSAAGSVTTDWSSPTFTAPARTDAANLSMNVKPDVAALLGIGAVTMDAVLVDTASPASSTVVASDRPFTASTSFAPVSLTVPPAALVAGRTYRISLRIRFASLVSASSSGTVGIDDVRLRMTELQPPTTLTASAPVLGATRVTGAVDPHGLATGVVVEYGPTAAYGSSTASVPVTGTGSQTWTAPLAGLSAGATYHYRVTATNADGTAQTSDATFVAPMPPSNAPPAVTGAGNSRTRTVVYDTSTDLAAVRIEVLSAGGTVLGSHPDSDRDGTLSITLPDADGTYGVRVVRDDNRAQTSTSATVPAALDRVAPDTSATALTVTPALGNVRDRAVTLSVPTDAVSAKLQVVDAGGINVGTQVDAPGGAATVQLGGADGSYRVRLTVVDASGNQASVLSSPVVLDTGAPAAGGTPRVTGAGNDRLRGVEFDRDVSTVTATIEVLAADNSVALSLPAATGFATLTLPDADGAYRVRVRQVDAAGNESVTALTGLTLDRVPPPAGTAPVVTGAGNDRARTVTIARDASAADVELLIASADGTQTASVALPSGTSASVTLPDYDSDYSIRYRQTDAAGNSSLSAATVVGLDRVAPDPGGAPSVTGAAATRVRSVSFARDGSAVGARIEVVSGGSVVASTDVAAGGAGTVTLPDADGSYSIRVRQTDATGNAATSPATGVVLDRSVPNAGAAPTVSGAGNQRSRQVLFFRDPTSTTVVIEAVDAGGSVVATASVPGGDSGTIVLPDLDGAYGICVRQTNSALNESVTPAASVTLDRVAPAAGGAPSVTGSAASRSRTVAFDRDPETAIATVEVVGAGGTVVASAIVSSGAGATVTLPAADGDYTIRVRQADAAGNVSTTVGTLASLDRTPPDPGGAPVVTGAASTRARTVAFARDASTDSATIEVVDGGGSVVASQVVSAGVGGVVTLPDSDGAYGVRIRQTDAAGNAAVSPAAAATLDRVAPDPGAAPVVTGAASARARTVAFVRDASTDSATVEVVDGGGAVVATQAVPMGALAMITLPDADGNYRVRVLQTDAAGNDATSPATAIGLDRVAPDPGAAPVVTGAGNVRLRTVTFVRDASTDLASVELVDGGGGVIDTATVAAGAHTAALTLPDADGDYRVRVRQVDAEGNDAASPIAFVSLDRVAPDAGPAPVLAGAGNVRARTLTFERDAATTAATVELLNAGGTVIGTVGVAPGGGSAALTLPDADGDYGIRVRQADAAGNEALTPVTDLTLDRVAPDPGAAPGVTGAGNARARTVTFDRDATTAVATVELLDAGGSVVGTIALPTGATTALTLPDADGAYRVRVRQVDAAGNAAASPVATLDLDRVAPDPGAAPGVTGAGNARARTVAFDRDATTAVATVEVLDAGGSVVETIALPTGATTALTLPDADGTYRVRVRQVDAAGNDALTPVTTVGLSRVGPDPGAAPRLSGAGNARTRSVEFDRDATTTVATVELLDTGGSVIDSIVLPTGSTTTLALPDADGTYRVRVRQVDGSANAATSPVTTVDLDRVAPDPGAAPGVSGAGNARARTIAFDRDAGADVATVEVLDAGGAVVATATAAAGASTASVTLPDADGAYRLRVRQIDAAGNDAASPVMTVTLDRVAPDPGAAPALSGADTARARTLTFDRDATTALATVELLDAGGSVIDTIALPTGAITGLTLPDADGDYRIRVRQVDAAGNEAVGPAAPLTLDRVAPNPGGAPRPAGPGNARSRMMNFDRHPTTVMAMIELVDAGGNVVDTIPVPTGASMMVTLPDADGRYRARVRQLDAAGNEAATQYADLDLDRDPPLPGPAPQVDGDPDALDVSFDRALDAAEVFLEIERPDGSRSAPVSVPAGTRLSTALESVSGDYRLRIVQRDGAGNESRTPWAVVTRAAAGGGAPGGGGGSTGAHGGNTDAGTGGSAAPAPPTAPPPPPPPPATDPPPVPGGTDAGDPGGLGAMLDSCFGGPITILDAAPAGKAVRITGAAKLPAGTALTIRDGRKAVVATTSVDATGHFAATAKRPTRITGKVNYRVTGGATTSKAFRLKRANSVVGMALAGSTVTVRGRVDVRQLGNKPSFEVRGGRGDHACSGGGTRLKVLGKPALNRRTGAYTVRAVAPAGTGPVALRTRAVGRIRSSSVFALGS